MIITNRFSHFVRRKQCGNRFISRSSHFVLKAVSEIIAQLSQRDRAMLRVIEYFDIKASFAMARILATAPRLDSPIRLTYNNIKSDNF